MTDENESVETMEATPDVWEAAMDAVLPAESEDAGQTRDEQGRFAAPDEDPAAEVAPDTETPVAAPVEGETPIEEMRRAFKVKLDHEEREVDLDALWATEDGKKELRERYEKGYGFDRAVERAKQDALRQGQVETVAWMKSRGFTFTQNPMSGQWEIQAPQAATPAASLTPPVATPDPAKDRARLEHVATYGDETDPAAQVRAIRELAKFDATDAASAKFAEFENWRATMSRQAQEARATTQRETVERNVLTSVQTAIEARAKSFEGPDKDRQIARTIASAMSKAKTDAKTMDEVFAIVTQAADDLDVRRDFWMKQAATPALPTKATPKPTPSLDGVPAGMSKGKALSGKLTGWDDPRLDDILA